MTTPTTCHSSEASDVEQQSQVALPSQSFSQTLAQTQLSSHPVLPRIPEPSSAFELCNLPSQAISMPPSPLPEASEAPASLSTQVSNRKQCAVEGCPELVAPTMWRHHMTLNAQRLLPGNVPDTWLKEHGLFICPDCQLLVANSHSLSHRTKCCTCSGGNIRYEFANVCQH